MQSVEGERATIAASLRHRVAPRSPGGGWGGSSIDSGALRRRRAHAHHERLGDRAEERAAHRHQQRIAGGREAAHLARLLLEPVDGWAQGALVAGKGRRVVRRPRQLLRERVGATHPLAATNTQHGREGIGGVAHDYLFANYVHPSDKHYPLEFRRFRKRDQCADASSFKSHTVLCQELVEWVIGEDIPGDFAFDSYFTNAPVMNHIHRHQRTYVGDLKANRVIEVSGVKQKVSEWTATPQPWRRTKFTVAGRTQCSYTKSVRLPNVDHPVRILVLWPSADAANPRKILVTNRTHWEAHRILKTYRRRWTSPRDLSSWREANVGMGECQLRSGVGQTRHMQLVVLAYTALMRQLKHDRSLDWAHIRLSTVGESCRLILRETLAKALEWVVERTREGMSVLEIKQRWPYPDCPHFCKTPVTNIARSFCSEVTACFQ